MSGVANTYWCDKCGEFKNSYNGTDRTTVTLRNKETEEYMTKPYLTCKECGTILDVFITQYEIVEYSSQ